MFILYILFFKCANYINKFISNTNFYLSVKPNFSFHLFGFLKECYGYSISSSYRLFALIFRVAHITSMRCAYEFFQLRAFVDCFCEFSQPSFVYTNYSSKVWLLNSIFLSQVIGFQIIIQTIYGWFVVFSFDFILHHLPPLP